MRDSFVLITYYLKVLIIAGILL